MRVQAYRPGQPCWSELATRNWQGAKLFYHKLFGWDMADMALPGTAFSLFTLEGEDLGAIYQVPDDMDEEHHTQWGIYFASTDVNVTIDRVIEAGGSLIMGPHEIGNAGRMAQLADPEGARFAVWQANRHSGAKRLREPGALCWVELACHYPAQALSFYRRVFGWDGRERGVGDMPYIEWLVGGESHGGMLELTAQWGDMPPHWMLYFQVEDTDRLILDASALGALVCVPATDIAGVGRFAVLKDPEGGVFAVIAVRLT